MPDIHPAVKAGGVIGAFAAAIILISSFEGERHTTYRDVGGVPTICDGSTSGVRRGDVATHEDCMQRLQLDTMSHAAAISPCIHVPVPDPALAAFISFSYNVGSLAFCRGSVARDLNAGNLANACNDLMKYVYAGGRRVQGLVNRRAAERAYCLKGVTYARVHR